MLELLNKFGLYNVLMVDDDLELCEVMKFYLSKIDSIKSIVTVHDGMSAAQKIRNQKFDLILLDMKMPKKNGYEMLDEFRGNPFNSVNSVVAMSGTMDMEILTINTSNGIKTFLIKPFTEDLFLEKIKKIITIEANKVGRATS
ncbi:response regulator [Bacteriovorax sp. PP10]|uniref:Response regulator n=1 Tax=Bacteriovorax antarcticus TaxID=3088717 RepID=A0ABU5VVM1_9BACT|nr:response regulator [Bacteriovorax sp. PP10]MEA9356438.1 response regulator [Bacteriovorax sp. PP10]